jgi:pyridoxamine 5'-phosphate oxidase
MTATEQGRAQAPWRNLFTSHITKLEDPYMVISTVSHNNPNRHSQPKIVPRARYCGFRGFFGELSSQSSTSPATPKLHPSALEQLKESNELNPPNVYESDMLSFTTDVRMGKASDLKEFDGAVEAVFWVKEVMTQWRMRGRGFVIGADPSDEDQKQARREIEKGLRLKESDHSSDEKSCEGWSWENEITTYFANHSPVMRGQWSIIERASPLTAR